MARKKTPPKKKSRAEGEIRKLQRSTDLLIRKAPPNEPAIWVPTKIDSKDTPRVVAKASKKSKK